MKSCLLSSAIALCITSSSFADGKEIEGERAPAQAICPSPEEAQKKMTVPEGYAVRCFAHEPMVVNPVAMTWDHRGRLWVVEGYEYPNGSPFKDKAFGGEAKDDQYRAVPAACTGKSEVRNPKSEIPRDRVVILEDTDNDGVADKRTIFVEGLDMGSAILCGDGGVYVGQQPHLIHFKDNDGDDHADEWRVCLTGFGREDTHELLNSFCWGPDGWLYMTHGVFTNSRVRRPGEPKGKGFKFDAGIGRCRPRSNGVLPLPNNDQGQDALATPWEFEVFADGTSNPWGCDYDARGNFFVSACVIDHFFHMAPGGIYVRQGGAPENPYAYEMLPSIVKHKHFRAAYAGVQIYQGGIYPADTHGHAFIGNIHDNAVHEEIITPVGATFKCEPRRDFLRANDGWFRPVSTQTGPDGNLWVMDWCDKYPCYQNAKANPEGVDRERGRIWRVVYTGEKSLGAPTVLSASSNQTNAPSKNEKNKIADKTVGAPSASRESREMDLSKLPTQELVKLLGDSNNWTRRMARRQLVERNRLSQAEMEAINKHWVKPVNAAVALEAFWTLESMGRNPERLRAADSRDPALRAWFARQVGDDTGFGELPRLARDADIVVRSAVATNLRQHVAGLLTVQRRAAATLDQKILASLIQAEAGSTDPLQAFSIWMVMEPLVTAFPEKVLMTLAEIAPASLPLSQRLTYKSLRRLCDTRDAKNLDLVVDFLEKISSHDVLLSKALEGLEKGQESGIIKPTKDIGALFAKLLAHSNADVRQHAQNLATLLGDPTAIRLLAEKLLNATAPQVERIAALQTLRKVRSDEARAAYAKLVTRRDGVSPSRNVGATPTFLDEILRAASDLGGEDTPAAILALWKTLTPAQRTSAAEALVARETWASSLLDAIKDQRVPASDVPMTARRALATHSNAGLKKRAEELLGQWRESPADIKALIIAKRKACLEGEPDLAQGKMIFTATCAVCHVFHGGGQKVGPDLIGSGRSNLDALLANVIDPNQIIGNGYENITVITKDKRTVAGRMIEDTPSHVKLLAIAGVEQVVTRDQIASLENTHQSVMPQGFGALPDDAFRNLVWYILSPPEEGPLTKEKKQLLSQGVEGGEAAKKKPATPSTRAIDWESVSLWNPEWKVEAPDFERTPVKLAEFHGRNNVLLMHPFTKDKPSALERTVKLGAGKPHKLTVTVAGHDQGDWELRVLINGRVTKKDAITHDGERWKTITADLSEHAGQEVKVRIEGAATGWSNEFSYWGAVKLE